MCQAEYIGVHRPPDALKTVCDTYCILYVPYGNLQRGIGLKGDMKVWESGPTRTI
jgi:hypothetical protein